MVDNMILDIISVINERFVTKGTIIENQQCICNHLYFIKSGCLRGFHYHNGKEITAWFGFENDFATSTYSFVSRKPAIEIIEAIEDSSILEISYSDLQNIYKKYPEFNIIGRLLTEKYYIGLMERTLHLQYNSAKENYELLIENHPHIIKRISLGYIASYLGISQETLSRIRAKK